VLRVGFSLRIGFCVAGRVFGGCRVLMMYILCVLGVVSCVCDVIKIGEWLCG